MDTPRPSPRTNRTRRVPHPVLIGHAASLPPYAQCTAGVLNAAVLGLDARGGGAPAVFFCGDLNDEGASAVRVPPPSY